jgi:hypothetical protein
LNSHVGLTDDTEFKKECQPKYLDNQLGREIPAPSFNEVCSIINKLKSGKAGGTDNMILELIKYGGRTLKQRIHRFRGFIYPH